MSLFFSKSIPNFQKKVECSLSKIIERHHFVTYKGVKCIKSPFDYVIYQMIINEIRPDLIIEIGTHEGGSALYLADLLKLTGKGEIHTIDIVDKRNKIIKDNPFIKFYLGGWVEYELPSSSQYDTILVIDDGSHNYEDVLGVLKKFHKVVTKDSYLIVEDGIIDKMGVAKNFNGGPQKAIKEFLKEPNDFIIDRKWCDFFGTNTTWNPNGFLKKTS